MNLRQLESFVTVATLGGMSRAAVHLQVAQPSVSRQIALLEKELATACASAMVAMCN